MRKTNTFAAVSEPPGRRVVTSAEQERIDDENRRRMLADGLSQYKSKNHLTNAQLGWEIGIGEKTVAKLLVAEVVKLTGEQYYRAWRLAGFWWYRVRKNEDLQIWSDKHILDATCGSRTIWFDKKCDAAVFLDNRVEFDTAIWKSTKNNSTRTLNVEPDIVSDFTDMPFPDNTFELVVFDPPHLLKVGENAWLRKKYGQLPQDWQKLVHDGFWECMRVLKPYGTLVFKWSDIQVSTRDVINAIGAEPLFGHRSGKKMNTHWMCYMKFPKD